MQIEPVWVFSITCCDLHPGFVWGPPSLHRRLGKVTTGQTGNTYDGVSFTAPSGILRTQPLVMSLTNASACCSGSQTHPPFCSKSKLQVFFFRKTFQKIAHSASSDLSKGLNCTDCHFILHTLVCVFP